MASLAQRFEAYERDYPHHSSFVNFSRAVKGQPLSKNRVAFYFKKMVDKDDYAKSDFKKLVYWIWENKATQKQGYFGAFERKKQGILPHLEIRKLGYV